MLQRKKKKNTVPASPGAARRTEILAKLIPWGMALIAEADGYGVEWKSMSIDEIRGAVIFAAQFARGE